jgi:hypothetical protein
VLHLTRSLTHSPPLSLKSAHALFSPLASHSKIQAKIEIKLMNQERSVTKTVYELGNDLLKKK